MNEDQPYNPGPDPGPDPDPGPAPNPYQAPNLEGQDANPQPAPPAPEPPRRYICTSYSIQHRSDVEYFSILGPNGNSTYVPTLVYRPVYEQRWMQPVLDGFVPPQMGDDQHPGDDNFEDDFPNDADIELSDNDTGHHSDFSDDQYFSDDEVDPVPPNVADNPPRNNLPAGSVDAPIPNPNSRFSIAPSGEFAYQHPNFSRPLSCYISTVPGNPGFSTIQPATPWLSLTYAATPGSNEFYTPSSNPQDLNRTNICIVNSDNQAQFILLNNQQNADSNPPSNPPSNSYYLPNPNIFSNPPNTPSNVPYDPYRNLLDFSFHMPPNPSENLLSAPPFHPNPNPPVDLPPDPIPNPAPNPIPNPPLNVPQFNPPNFYPVYPQYSPHLHTQYSPNVQHRSHPLFFRNLPNPRFPRHQQYPQPFSNAQYPQYFSNLQYPPNPQIPNRQYLNNYQYPQHLADPSQLIPPNRTPIFPPPRLPNLPQNACCPQNCCKGNRCCQHFMCGLKRLHTQSRKNYNQRESSSGRINSQDTPCCSVICCESSCCRHANCKKKNRPIDQDNNQPQSTNKQPISSGNSPKGENSPPSPQIRNTVNQISNSLENPCCSVSCCKSSCCQHLHCRKNDPPNIPSQNDVINAASAFSNNLNFDHLDYNTTIDDIKYSPILTRSKDLVTCAESTKNRTEDLESQPSSSGSSNQPLEVQPTEQSSKILTQSKHPDEPNHSPDNDNKKPSNLNKQYYKMVSGRTMPKPQVRHDIPIPVTVVKSQISSVFKMVDQNDGTTSSVAQYDCDVDGAIHSKIKLAVSCFTKYNLSQTDFLRTKAINTFLNKIFINSEGNIHLEFAFNLFVEITRDFGIRMSCPEHQIFLAISAASTHVGLYHPSGRFYNFNEIINVQTPYINNISRLAKITADGRFFFMHTDSHRMFEISQTNIKKIRQMDFLNLDDDFTKRILLCEGHHGPSEANRCLDMIQEEGLIKFGDNKDELLIGNIQISQTHDGNLTLSTSSDIRLQISPKTKSCRINTPSYRAKASSPNENINFFYEDENRRIIKHLGSFIVRLANKSGGFDDKNKLQSRFKKLASEPPPMFNN